MEMSKTPVRSKPKRKSIHFLVSSPDHEKIVRAAQLSGLSISQIAARATLVQASLILAEAPEVLYRP